MHLSLERRGTPESSTRAVRYALIAAVIRVWGDTGVRSHRPDETRHSQGAIQRTGLGQVQEVGIDIIGRPVDAPKPLHL